MKANDIKVSVSADTHAKLKEIQSIDPSLSLGKVVAEIVAFALHGVESEMIKSIATVKRTGEYAKEIAAIKEEAKSQGRKKLTVRFLQNVSENRVKSLPRDVAEFVAKQDKVTFEI